MYVSKIWIASNFCGATMMYEYDTMLHDIFEFVLGFL
jgi:hypothetical protein